jgi:CheY-like chemotaxis protein
MDAPSGKTYAHTVLAVDDDPFILDAVARYLMRMGLRVVTTTDPETVLSLAQKEKPNLIISDIAMPGMDGLTLLKTLKETPATRDIPVILLTSSRSADDVQEGLSTGAEAYLSKPIEWERSWPKIQAILLRS